MACSQPAALAGSLYFLPFTPMSRMKDLYAEQQSLDLACELAAALQGLIDMADDSEVFDHDRSGCTTCAMCVARSAIRSGVEQGLLHSPRT